MIMVRITFAESKEDSLIKYSVIVSRHKGKWVFCKHKDRNTYEVPGGHRETGEAPLETAERELTEETGAVDYTITPVCIYSVLDDAKGEESFGALYYAEIFSFEKELNFEIESIHFFDDIPKQLTYPQIQPQLIKELIRRRIVTDTKNDCQTTAI